MGCGMLFPTKGCTTRHPENKMKTVYQKNMMKHQHLPILLACASALTLTIASAQRGRPAGGPPAFFQALPEIYGILEAADVNNDNQLDADEQSVLVEAMKDGTLTKPEWVRGAPDGVEVTHANITSRLALVYATLAPFDADDNGEMTLEELGTIRAAVMSGQITPPFGRGGNQGGRRFGPPQGTTAAEHPEEVPAFADRLPEIYETLSAADANQDGTLDAAEQAVLAGAMEDGTLTKPEGLPQAPEGIEVSPDQIVKRLSAMYARLFKLDANVTGTLEEEELASIQNTAQRPGRPQAGSRSGRPQGSGRPNASTQSGRPGGRSLGGARPARPQR